MSYGLINNGSVSELTERQIKDILSSAHPIGSVYISDDATSPAELFGGIWEQIKDKFILAAGDTYSAGSTGGEESVILSERNIPKMWNSGGVVAPVNTKGTAAHVGQWGWIYQAIQVQSSEGYDSYDGHWVTVGTQNNTPVNNMPPYIAMYVWKRLADAS